ncbi:transcriptional regulator GlxA family with amidase domain [Streptomyces griseochromogenes]|uniref:AraC family transcriptional regulator n=1 Tax=Streptomyces griseochromogenes TaxID=68214 RepID=A0A1B1B2I0_9ACTN|nr:helix-turn-helix domain-containing protein [Streptomyces griseochromogenes]ANP52962.1 AraC family transcriptional regulator [Streptomyces griseochromogenes]MBP2047612.1 transcriptional regulator GlxA family with amidase domain [Streptomyces griseochromogenes]
MEVSVMAYDGVFDSGLCAALDVLEAANAMRGELPQPPPAWNVTTIGFSRQVRTGAGHIVTAEPASVADTADLLLVPALAERRPDALLERVAGPDLAEVRTLVAERRGLGTPVASACTGTFLLAESGILDGRRATTTWWLAPVFRRRYPTVALDETSMVITSQGVTTAGAAFGHVDLALAVVRMASPALADLVARYLVVDERPSQSAYTIPSALAQSDPLIAAFERWARLHLDTPNSLTEAAQALGVSERTLQRTLRRVLNTTPVRFVQDLRVEQATHLLRTTDLSLETIARKVGYEHAATLRTLLRDRTGATTAGLRTR